MQLHKVVQQCPALNDRSQLIVDQLRSDNRTLLQLERELFTWLMGIGLFILQSALRCVLEDATWAQRMRDRARTWLRVPMRSKGRDTVTLRTIFGALQVPTTRWVRDRRGRPGQRRKTRRQSGSGMLPVLWALGVRSRCSPALQHEVTAAMAICASCDEASDLLGARGIQVCPKDVCRVSYDTTRRALDQRDRILFGNELGAPAVEQILAGRRVAVMIDGGRFKARHSRRRGRRTAKGRHGFTTAWREPKGFVIYVLDDDGKPDKKVTTLCDFTTGDATDVMRLLTAYLKAYGIEQAELLEVVADGACWIWERVDEMRVDLRLADHGVELVEVLDFYHGVEHLALVSELVKRWPASRRKRWLKTQRHQLRHGSPEAVLDAIEALRPLLAKRSRKVFERELAYFQGHRERLHYADVEARGLVLGSGAIESAIRRVINQRVKSNSCFWLPENAELVMHARAQLKFGRFDELIERATAPYPFSSC